LCCESAPELLAFRTLPVDQVAKCRAARGGGGTLVVLLALVQLDLGSACLFPDSPDAEADLLFVLIHLDDLEVVNRINLKLHWRPVLVDSLGHMAEALDALGDFNERAELSGP